MKTLREVLIFLFCQYTDYTRDLGKNHAVRLLIQKAAL